MSQTLQTPLPLSDLALEQWVKLIDNAPVVGFDFETTGLDVYDGTDIPRGFSIGLRSGDGYISNYFPISHPIGENLLSCHWRLLLERIRLRPLVMHNAPFDLSVLYHMGIPEPAVFFCTQKLDHLLNENFPSYKLDYTTERWLGYRAKGYTAEFNAALLAWGWAGMPSQFMHKYASNDGAITIHTLDNMVKSKEFTPKLVQYWQKIEQPTLSLLGKMRREGVRIDIDYCHKNQLIGEARMLEIEQELGGRPSERTFLKRVLNDELGIPLLLNKKGKVSYDKDTMKRYEARLRRISESTGRRDIADLASRVLEYRGWQKAVSGYYVPYQRFVSPDGRLRASYNSTGTRTGRFSCSDPNLQQIPKEADKVWSAGVKGALIAKPGFTLWEIDYSQLEFRLAAAAAKEQSLLSIFADPDRDLFSEMAVVLGMVRQDTKTFTYSVQYGAGVPRVMDAFNVGEAQAKEMLGNFYEQFPMLRAASQHFGRLCKNTGYVELWTGRRRHFPNPEKEYYKAFNSYIQGGAADLVKQAMVECDREVCDENCILLLQVHDSIVFEVRNGYEDLYLPKAQEIMVRHSDYFGVQLAADTHRWSKNDYVEAE